MIDFIWVGDLAERIARVAKGSKPHAAITIPVHGSAALRISELLKILDGFRHDYFELDIVPDLTTPLRSTLYTTFLSHIDLADHVHRPKLHSDARGDLCEAECREARADQAETMPLTRPSRRPRGCPDREPSGTPAVRA